MFYGPPAMAKCNSRLTRKLVSVERATSAWCRSDSIVRSVVSWVVALAFTAVMGWIWFFRESLLKFDGEIYSKSGFVSDFCSMKILVLI